MGAMKENPAVYRTLYAFALLAERDAEKAGEMEKKFEKCASGYPYPNEIESERELMAIVRERMETGMQDPPQEGSNTDLRLNLHLDAGKC